MKSLRTRPSSVVALAALLAALPASAYAFERPHTHEDLVAHSRAARGATPFPTSGLAVGPPPAIPYAFASKPEFGEGNWRLERPDGTSLKLPRITWSAWAPMGDGAIGMAGTEAGPQLKQVSGDGTVRTRMVSNFGLAISPDDEIVAWLGDHGRPHVVEGAGSRRFTMARLPHGHRIASIWGEHSCLEAEPEGGGCTIFVNARRRVWISDSHGIVVPQGPMLQAADVNQRGRVIGLVSRRTPDRPDCWGAFKLSGHRVFKTCDYYLHAYSPDGRRILAERSRSLWWSVRRFAILGRDGHVVHSWTFDATKNRSLSQLTWEDSHHLLGVLRAHGQWGIVRIGTDGSVEYAGPTVPATDEFTAFSLPVR